MRFTATIKKKNMLGRYETEEESINRLKAELESTRDYIFPNR